MTELPNPVSCKPFVFIGIYLVERLQCMEKWSSLTSKLYQKIIILYGKKQGFIFIKLFISDVLTISCLILYVSTLVSIFTSPDYTILLFGIILTCGYPIFRVRKLDKQIMTRQRKILLDLPELLNQIVLLVNAGETVLQAIMSCTAKTERHRQSILYQEFSQVIEELKVNSSLPLALENFNKRCVLAEITLFTTTILMNYRKGGSEFVFALQALSNELWQRRKAVTRTLGEEASSKLVFPMVIVFLVVMVIVASPAILIMNSQ